MSDLILTGNQNSSQSSPFDAIRKIDEQGNEYWMARDLMTLLGYPRWQDFKPAIDRAMASFVAHEGSNLLHEHFSDSILKTGGRPREEFRLSRYASYLTAMNGDSRKPEIAAAQSYFAVKTREAETVIPKQIDRIRELELELELTKAKRSLMSAETRLLQFRHTITTTCSELVQQKIFGYQLVEKVEYRDRIIKDEEIINDGTTINKSALCHRYNLLTPKGAPDYRRLNKYLESCKLPSEAWKLTANIRSNEELRREYLEQLDSEMMSDDRQLFLGEYFE